MRDKDTPLLSRRASPLGKNDKRFEVGLPEPVYDKICALALLQGYSAPTEWARDLIIRTILGEWESTRIRSGNGDVNPERLR